MPLTVARAGEDVPAILWLSARPAPRRPLVLLGHGGGMHKQSPYSDRLGNWLAGGPGFACLAIDLPFHGERTRPREVGLSALARRGRMGLDGWRERNAGATGQAVADWRAAIDAAQESDETSYGPVGYFGLSMGTRFGVPLIAAEPRIVGIALERRLGGAGHDRRLAHRPGRDHTCCGSARRRSTSAPRRATRRGYYVTWSPFALRRAMS